jgi:RES domain-containing protein
MRVRQLSSVFCRCVRDVFAPLDTTGALRAGGRFNPRGLAALYLAEDPDLAMRESAQAPTWAGFEPFAPRRVVCVRIELQRVIDLTDEATLSESGLAADHLTASRSQSPEPTSTQLFGEWAFLDGVEAIAYPSAMDPSRSNIVVFPDNILEGSRVELVQQDR